MEFEIAENKIYLEDKDGKKVAFIQFKKADNNVLIADKTFVGDSLQGQGIAAKLVEELVLYARKNNKKIQPSCSYVVKAFEKNPTYHDVRAEDKQ